MIQTIKKYIIEYLYMAVFFICLIGSFLLIGYFCVPDGEISILITIGWILASAAACFIEFYLFISLMNKFKKR